MTIENMVVEDVTGQSLQGLDDKTLCWLEEIGITTRSELALIGAATAYEMIREVHPEATVSLAGELLRAASGRRRTSKLSKS